MPEKNLSAELLLDTEASLRMADGLIEEFRLSPDSPRFPQVMLHAQHEILTIIQDVRSGRAALEDSILTCRLRTQPQRLAGSSATEPAAAVTFDDRGLVLNHVSSLLLDIEARMSAVADLFDPPLLRPDTAS